MTPDTADTAGTGAAQGAWFVARALLVPLGVDERDIEVVQSEHRIHRGDAVRAYEEWVVVVHDKRGIREKAGRLDQALARVATLIRG